MAYKVTLVDTARVPVRVAAEIRQVEVQLGVKVVPETAILMESLNVSCPVGHANTGLVASNNGVVIALATGVAQLIIILLDDCVK